jgi:cytochrome c biogenesis protein CcmG, thiol:disulfide interchange protein DsbE
MNLRPAAILPVVLFAALGGALALGLTHDPKTIPSMLIDRKIPDFKLPSLIPGEAVLDSTKLQDRGLVLINVFSSWCSGCRLEHPYLMEKTKDKRFVLVGLNWKDNEANAQSFIGTYGNPFAQIGADPSGRVGIDLGVTGVPETFVLDSTGRVRLRVPGPMTPEIWRVEIEPLIEKEKRS